ncbi:class I adenylate-forming enzyme family protein [Nocardioides humi]|uniref:Fatty-acid--CoA ligase FadD8 n=1 Tax=Nocardioides humi TaxID=449461 RepID=A0ABN2A7H0_9ACTN|nr:AMP-binding protein [Nocardioides humi]
MNLPVTLWEAFHRSLTTNAERPALAYGAEELTYAELASAVADARARLVATGVRGGSRVVLLQSSGLAFPVYDLAVMSIGAVKVPLNPMSSAGDVRQVLDRTEPAAVVVTDDLVDLLAGQGRTPVLRAEYDVRPGRASELPDGAVAEPGDAAVIYFTGGTTGAPKGVVHSQEGTLSNLLAHLLEGDIRRDERLLLTTPLAHAAGLFTLAALLRGAHARIEPGFDARRALRLMREDATTWTFAVPTMIYRLLDASDESGVAPTSLRTLQYGAAPIAPEQLARALDTFGPVLQQLYAQTENPNYATVLRKEDHVRALREPHLLTSCGRASILCDVAVLDGDGSVVPPGTEGEIALRSPYVMTGYWRDLEGHRSRFAGSWLLTGDIGRMDEEHFLYVVDRRNDMIISGGMNVYSVEVEQALTRHPAVLQAAVVGVPHPDWGESVHAVVVAGEVSIEELLAHCREQLAAYKVPKSVELRAELPLTAYGKLDKKALRAALAEARG